MRLWVIQLGACFPPRTIELLAFPLGKIKQPRVISEVIGGIILGPTKKSLDSLSPVVVVAAGDRRFDEMPPREIMAK
jgi:hypothetical protein